MKNWGKFFILILIITVFTACGQKGEGGGTVPSTNIPSNKIMTSLIINNSYEISGLSQTFPRDIYLSNITNTLYQIASFYDKGGTLTTLNTYDSELNDSVNDFFRYGEGRGWMTYS